MKSLKSAHARVGLSQSELGLCWLAATAARITSEKAPECSVPVHMQHVAATLLQDYQWFDNVFLPNNVKMLKNSYNFAVEKLDNLGVKVFESQV